MNVIHCSFICHRQTTVVLATVDTSDFLYTCSSHLTDPGFATPLAAPAISPSPSGSSTPTPSASAKDKPKLSDAEIKKIAEEWEEKQRLKKEKDKDKDKADDGPSDDKDTTNDEKKKKIPPPPAPIPVPTSTSTPTPASSHPQFVLHRQIFAMRVAEHKKRRQSAQVKQIAPRLPSVPSGGRRRLIVDYSSH